MNGPGTTSLEGAVSGGRLGERVRALRRASGLTLDTLAEESGVSRAMLSKVERGEKNPTLVVAAKISDGLGVSFSRLLGQEERREVVVVPREGRLVARDPASGFERHLLSPPSAGRGVEFARNLVPVGASSGEFPAHRRRVEEYVAVETGRLCAVLAGQEYVLEEGDALYFEADVPHRFDNAGDVACAYYLVISRREAG